MKSKILIVDDHPVVRHGLARLVAEEEDLAVCGEASSVNEALAAIEKLAPDVIIVDITLKDSDGIDLIRMIRARDSRLPILVLSMHDESVYGEKALRAGANGYVMKEQADEVVVEAVRQVLAGELYVSRRLSEIMLRQYIGGQPAPAGSIGVDRLSDREREVFECIGRGMSSQKIAEQLGLSIRTVEVHRAHIKQKLEIDETAQLIRQATLWVEGGGQDGRMRDEG